MTPAEIANIDGSPSISVVEDFCRCTKGFSTELPSEWEPIEEHLLDSLLAPDEPIPYKAWRVTQNNCQWMIYMWYENESFDSDTYLYEEVNYGLYSK